MKILSIDDVAGEKFGAGAFRKVLVHSNDLMMVYNGVPPGAKLAHSHPHEQMGYIIKGVAKLTVSGEEVVLKDGASYSLEPNEHHEFEIIGSEPAVILDIFRPPRDDYLPKE